MLVINFSDTDVSGCCNCNNDRNSTLTDCCYRHGDTPKAELPYLLQSSNQERNNPPMKEGMNQFRAVYTTPNPDMNDIPTRHGNTNLDSN